VDGHSDPDQKTTTLMIREISEHKRAEETLRSSGEQLREFAARLEAVREEERARVAREIHDELGTGIDDSEAGSFMARKQKQEPANPDRDPEETEGDDRPCG